MRKKILTPIHQYINWRKVFIFNTKQQKAKKIEENSLILKIQKQRLWKDLHFRDSTNKLKGDIPILKYQTN